MKMQSTKTSFVFQVFLFMVVVFSAQLTYAVDADSFEPNNSVATAKSITIGEIQTHNMHVVGDEDWLTFTLVDNIAEVVIETDGNSDSSDTVLTLYSSSNMIISQNDDIGGGSHYSRITIPSLIAGTYYINVHEFSSDEVIDHYTISLSALGPDVYEENNTKLTASSISNNEVQDHSFHLAGDEDFLTFTLVNEVTNLSIETSGDPGTNDTVLTLYDSNDTVIGHNDDVGFGSLYSKITIPNLIAGTYYINVHEFSSNKTIPHYSILLSYSEEECFYSILRMGNGNVAITCL